LTTFRAFIAVDLSPEIRMEIEALVARLRRMPGQECMRFVSASGIHLTLRFLGDIPAEMGDRLEEALERAAAARTAINVRIRGAGCFPDLRRPRVIWVGLEEPRGELTALQRAIEAECVALGLPVEDRPFSPHLTLGRVRRESGADAASFVRSVLEHEQAVDLGEMTVDSVHLFRSDLRPTGAEYRRLHSAVLDAGR
jgi:RNA 2',3'-cyclic 3'-phosphodiesterase